MKLNCISIAQVDFGFGVSVGVFNILFFRIYSPWYFANVRPTSCLTWACARAFLFFCRRLELSKTTTKTPKRIQFKCFFTILLFDGGKNAVFFFGKQFILDFFLSFLILFFASTSKSALYLLKLLASGKSSYGYAVFLLRSILIEYTLYPFDWFEH